MVLRSGGFCSIFEVKISMRKRQYTTRFYSTRSSVIESPSPGTHQSIDQKLYKSGFWGNFACSTRWHNQFGWSKIFGNGPGWWFHGPSLKQLLRYSIKWKQDINFKKTCWILFHHQVAPRIPEISIEGRRIDHVKRFKYLGTLQDAKLSFVPHINQVRTKTRTN